MNSPGRLSVVATPIGNIGDLSARALQVLREADCILCEDTRHTAGLLCHYGIKTPTESLHEHNETAKCHNLVNRLSDGAHFAMVSDAGTPLVSDPGCRLVIAAHEAGVTVTPIPGACAGIAALSAAGMRASRFVFEGFVAAQAGARRKQFQSLVNEQRTLVFYEVPHRIVASLQALEDVFGNTRNICLVKEISKVHEKVLRGTAESILVWLRENRAHCRGEFVIVVEGATGTPKQTNFAADELLAVLCKHLPPGKAAAVVASLTGDHRSNVYRKALRSKASGTKTNNKIDTPDT